MDRESFIEAMWELWGDEMSDNDLSDAYDTYTDLIKLVLKATNIITPKSSKELLALESMSSMDTDQRLKWRTALAEMGHELTPLQVDQYISIVEMALEG